MSTLTTEIVSTEMASDEHQPLPPIHPGEILRFELLEPYGITPDQLAKDLGVSSSHIVRILDGKRAITADTALRLSKYFGMSAQMWMNMQTQYDLLEAERENAPAYDAIQRRKDCS